MWASPYWYGAIVSYKKKDVHFAVGVASLYLTSETWPICLIEEEVDQNLIELLEIL